MKYTINELANSKGVSQPVREALLQMADYKQLYEQVCEQYDVLAKEFEVIKQALAAPVQEPGGLAGQGRELHRQLLEAGRELLRSANEPEKWGSVGPGPTEIAWDKFSNLASHVCTGIDSPPAAQPAVPDAFGTREGEHPQYIQGWNDCRAEMLKGMKP